jgi:uncharacterized protein (TIGR03437 family)
MSKSNMRSIKTATLFLLALAAFPWQSSAQSYDSSGNNLLNGTYYVRQVIYVIQDSQAPGGSVGEAVNMQGTITFDGNGNYTLTNGSYLDASVGTVVTGVTNAGTYAISASGMGYISAVLGNIEVDSTDQIVGLVSHGIFIGSSTENAEGYNDLFIAAPIGALGATSPVATNATLNGTYQVAYMDPTVPEDAIFTMSADGAGNIGTVNVNGFFGNDGASSQTLTGVTYSFSNGAAQLNFGGTASNTTFFTGTELLYISPDGNFIFGGSFLGYDMFVGVRAATSNPTTSNGLYYQLGLDLDVSQVSEGGNEYLDTYYGAIDALPCTLANPCPSGATGNIIGHQRENLPLVGLPYDYTYYDSYTLGGNGSSTDGDFGQTYWSTKDGSIRIGYGAGPYLSLNVALQAPSFSGSGVYLNPTGVLNAASSSPFTAHLSPGEFLTLYGSGLAASTQSATVPFPNNLGGVQVMINDIPAPIYFVSPNQISVVVPYLTTQAIAQIRVVNNAKDSNIVTQFVGQTSAGVFTNPVGGIGYAAALHPDYSVVSPDSPAQIGETVAVYLAGMGAVSPTVADGSAAPSSSLAYTTATPTVNLYDQSGNGETATVSYSGLAPGFAGLYQINFVVPSGLVSSPATLEIVGPDSDSVEALLPFTTTTSDATPAARPKLAKPRTKLHHYPLARPVPVTGDQPSGDQQ